MSSLNRASDAMNASLQREYKRILALLKTEPETIEARHAVGAVVAAVKRDPDKYGKQAVMLLASALGRDEATLYRFAQVAARWTSEEVAEWIARGEASRNRLSWWHFVEASAVSRRREREELLWRATADGLSVRVLARLAEKGRHPRRTGPRLVRELEVLVRRTSVLGETWDDLRRIGADEARNAISIDLLDRARALHAELVAHAERALGVVDALRREIDVEKLGS